MHNAITVKVVADQNLANFKSIGKQPTVLGLLLTTANIVFPLILGGLIYFAWRSPSLLMFQWAETLGFSPYVQELRAFADPLRPAVPGWVLFSFPDGAWVYSATAAYLAIWRVKWSVEPAFWVLLPGAMGVGSELGQWFGVVPGTFDPVDLALMLIAVFTAVLMIRRIK